MHSNSELLSKLRSFGFDFSPSSKEGLFTWPNGDFITRGALLNILSELQKNTHSLVEARNRLNSAVDRNEAHLLLDAQGKLQVYLPRTETVTYWDIMP